MAAQQTLWTSINPKSYCMPIQAQQVPGHDLTPGIGDVPLLLVFRQNSHVDFPGQFPQSNAVISVTLAKQSGHGRRGEGSHSGVQLFLATAMGGTHLFFPFIKATTSHLPVSEP